MLSDQSLEQMLLDSKIARDFFDEGKAGFFRDNDIHDLFYDSHKDQILERHNQDPQQHYDPHQNLICRIYGNEEPQYVWPNIDYKKFIEICLHDFQIFLHTPELQAALGAVTEIEKDIQQPKAKRQQQQPEQQREQVKTFQQKQDMELEI
jgi:hypothetical protein